MLYLALGIMPYIFRRRSHPLLTANIQRRQTKKERSVTSQHTCLAAGDIQSIGIAVGLSNTAGPGREGARILASSLPVTPRRAPGEQTSVATAIYSIIIFAGIAEGTPASLRYRRASVATCTSRVAVAAARHLQRRFFVVLVSTPYCGGSDAARRRQKIYKSWTEHTNKPARWRGNLRFPVPGDQCVGKKAAIGRFRSRELLRNHSVSLRYGVGFQPA